MGEQHEDRPFFYGCSEHRIQAKGQVALPMRYRAILSPEAIAKGFVLVEGEAPCIYMYTHDEFGRVKDRVRKIAEENGDPEFFRCFMEGAVAVDLDTQGRFVLPQELREKVGIRGDRVLFLGMDDRIELWDVEHRQEVMRSRSAFEEQRRVHARRIFGM